MHGKMDLKWPQRDDKAFKGSGSRKDCLLDDFVVADPWAYACGFKFAADKLVDAASADSDNPDLLFFPIAYLYRHYLELELKNFLVRARGLDLVSVKDKTLIKHNLHKLWNKARKAITARWPNDPCNLDTVEKIILEFHRVDPTGQGLRFAKDTKGKPHRLKLPECISLSNLKRVMMEDIETFFNGCNASLEP